MKYLWPRTHLTFLFIGFFIYENLSAIVLGAPLLKPANAEIRAIMDEATEWTSESGAFKTIRRIKDAGFNTYIPCVWHGKGSRFPTRLVSAEPNLVFGERDPLAYLIQVAHQNNIEVHPWFCVTLRQREFLEELYDIQKTPKKAFDVHRPEFQQFILNLIADVVHRYDVDGVNLDYIRTMGICECSFCKKKYQETYGRDLRQDILGSGNLVRLEPHLQEWQDSTIKEILRKISTHTKNIKPHLVISVSGRPRLPSEPTNTQGRQEVKWANAGIIDLIYCMNYRLSPDFKRHAILKDLLTNRAKAIMLLGNFERTSSRKVIPRDARLITRLVKGSRERWSDGFGVYLYSQLDDNQVRELHKMIYSFEKK